MYWGTTPLNWAQIKWFLQFAFHRILSFQKLKIFYQPKGLKQLTIVKTSPKSYQKQYLGRFKINKMQIVVKIEVLFEKTHCIFQTKLGYRDYLPPNFREQSGIIQHFKPLLARHEIEGNSISYWHYVFEYSMMLQIFC